MKYLAHINKTKLFDVLFIILILASFAVKMTSFDYPFTASGGEAGRDYLIASHSLQYKEFPLVAPFSGPAEGRVPNSPLYYYFLTSLLVIDNSVLSLELASIILQFLIILFVYILGRKAFGPAPGFIAAFIFSIILISTFREGLWHESYIWPLYIMRTFVHLSYLLLFLSYVKKNYAILLTGIIAFIIASVMHSSAFAMLPLFLIVAFFILKSMKKSMRHYGGVLLATIGSLLLFYFPVFIYLIKTRTTVIDYARGLVGGGEQVNIVNALFHDSNFLQYFTSQLTGLWTSIFAAMLPDPSGYVETGRYEILELVLIISFFAAAGIYFFVLKKPMHKKIYMGIIMLALAEQLFFMSILSVKRGGLYFFPVYGLFFLAIAELGYSLFTKNTLLKIGGVVFIFIFAYVFTSSTVFNNIKQAHKWRLYNLGVINSATDAIINEVLAIQKREGFENLDFFQIIPCRIACPETLTPDERSKPGNSRDFGVLWTALEINKAVLWIPLEKKLNKKFLRLNTLHEPQFIEINNDDYIFLACFEFTDPVLERTRCVEALLLEKPLYTIEKKLFSQEFLSIYLAKK